MIGVLALQGGYEAHTKMLDKLGLSHRLVKLEKHLEGLDALILPGGESTTMLKLMDIYDLVEPLKAFGRSGKPVLATCAGAILLAETVHNPQQFSLGLIPVGIDRNFYGSQRDSFRTEQTVTAWDLKDSPVLFIRAPHFRDLGEGVKELSRMGDHITGVSYKNFTAVTYHPELTDDTRFHEAWFTHCVEPARC